MQEQDSDNALDRLAERMGIEAEFQNARGQIVPTAPETKRRLLAAMGVEAADEAAAEAALAELDRDEWLRPLAPVQVVRADAGTGRGRPRAARRYRRDRLASDTRRGRRARRA